MDAQLEAELIECLDALAQGEALERILARYPQDTAQLRPLLETAAGLAARRLEPSEAAKMRSREKFLAQAGSLRRTAPRKTLGFLPRLAAGFVAAALVAGVLGTGAVAASGTALPGDPLYGLKRTVEDMRLQSASSPTQRQALQIEFEQRRISETNELLDAGRKGEVEFTGIIEAIQPNAWIVSGLVVQLDANTQIAGTPRINQVAEVHGVTGPTGLRASSISITSTREPELTSTPEGTETPQATETLEPTETPAPPTATIAQPAAKIRPTLVATATPQPANTQQPSAAPRPTETAEPTSTPEPVEVEFSGSVNAMDSGMWNIDGTTVSVDNNTAIQGGIHTGQRVKVKALRLTDGSLIATSIELSGNVKDSNLGGNDPQNSNANQNSNDGNSNGNDSNSNHNGDNSNEDHGSSNHNNNSHDYPSGNGNGN